jgi:hypothetical protein
MRFKLPSRCWKLDLLLLWYDEVKISFYERMLFILSSPYSSSDLLQEGTANENPTEI